MGERPDDDADRQPLDSHDRRKEDRGADDRKVIEERRDRRYGELLVAVEDPRHHCAHADEDGADEHDPGQVHAQLGGGRIIEGRDDRHEHRGQDGHDEADGRQADEHEVDDAAGERPCLLVLAARPIAGEDRDERRAQRAGDDELEDRVGNAEGGEVRIHLARRAELRPDDEQANPAEDPAGERGDRQDQAGVEEHAGGGDPLARLRRRHVGRRDRGSRAAARLALRHRPARPPDRARGCAWR